ncbi:MAG: 23S rRNA (guanosine(2251)-2'-O)-methyltransferase RlmB [Magnetococcus sp. DMHC-1]|nr:23S rRNA (guanosine(2251)-2'-O)-methyltransferase RlmB [Magnetococcales bacterium]
MKQTSRQSDSSPPEALIHGINAVLALLQDSGRGVAAVTVLDGSRNPRLHEIVQLARSRQARLRFVDRATLDRLSGGAVHQGVVAHALPRAQPQWSDLLARISRLPSPILLFLDGIEDPHNLGAILRSAAAFGVEAVVQTKDRSAPLTAVAEKAAAGATAHVDLVRVTNLAQALEELRNLFIPIYGLVGEAPTTLAEVKLTPPLVLVMGGEGSGLRRLTREKCDQLLAIPMAGGVGSLNVSVATGVALYEVFRQQKP